MMSAGTVDVVDQVVDVVVVVEVVVNVAAGELVEDVGPVTWKGCATSGQCFNRAGRVASVHKTLVTALEVTEHLQDVVMDPD